MSEYVHKCVTLSRYVTVHCVFLFQHLYYISLFNILIVNVFFFFFFLRKRLAYLALHTKTAGTRTWKLSTLLQEELVKEVTIALLVARFSWSFRVSMNKLSSGKINCGEFSVDGKIHTAST